MPSHSDIKALAIEAQIQEVTEAMQAQSMTLLDLKRQRNEVVPIGRLPDEILETLFLCFRDTCAESESSAVNASLRSPGWVSKTWVCHRFRALCLGYPLLWSRIGDYRHKWMFAFVQRSIPSPMDVHMNIDLHGKYPLKRILESVFRMRTLELEGDALTMRDRVLPRLNIPAPELATLSLRTHGHIYGINSAAILNANNIIDNAFRNEVPRLRRLEIGRIVHIYPSSPLISSLLEHLDIEGSYAAAELLGLLQETPGLCSLAAKSMNLSAYQTNQWAAFESLKTLDLPRLSSFKLEITFVEQVAHLLQTMKVPALCSTSLTLTSFPFISTKDVTVLPALSSLLQQSNNNTGFQSLRLHPVTRYTEGYSVCERVYLWHAPCAGTDSKISYIHPPLAQAYIEFRPLATRPVTPAYALLPFYKHICADLPLGGVKTLTIEMEYVFTSHEWADVLRPLSRVEHLKLVGERLSTVLDALVLSPFIFPTLSRIAVCIPLRKTSTPPPLLRALREVAEARAKGQSRMRIAFEDCDRFAPALYEELREFADVTWNNITFFDDNVLQDEEPWLALMPE
ncbi:hypothetical protein PENSPDRAFT_658532 [Peniophora sp. CONT]|nr:hypothetical protein PENSPDRAFT_658532 [Peniophora sp. CONT]